MTTAPLLRLRSVPERPIDDQPELQHGGCDRPDPDPGTEEILAVIDPEPGRVRCRARNRYPAVFTALARGPFSTYRIRLDDDGADGDGLAAVPDLQLPLGREHRRGRGGDRRPSGAGGERKRDEREDWLAHAAWSAGAVPHA